MSMLGASGWFFAGRRTVPIRLVNAGMSLVNQTDQAVFSGLPYGAPSSTDRLCIVCVTGEEATSGLVTIPGITWGGVTLAPAETVSAGTGAGGGSISCCSGIFAGFVPSGASGDLVCTIEKSASATENIDSIAVSTLVTTLSPSAVKIDSDDEVGFADPTIVVNNVQTVADGFAVGCAALSDHSVPFSSLAGNGLNGAFAELVDVSIASDHRHGVFLLTPTVAQTTEDFTSTAASNIAVHVLAVASFQGGNA